MATPVMKVVLTATHSGTHSVADPEGAPIPGGGNLLSGKMLAEKCMKMKEIGANLDSLLPFDNYNRTYFVRPHHLCKRFLALKRRYVLKIVVNIRKVYKSYISYCLL